MKKILILTFVGLLLSGLSSCQTTGNNAELFEKAKQSAVKLAGDPQYNAGDISKTIVIEKNQNYIFLENKTVAAKPFSYWSPVNERYELSLPAAYIKVAREHCAYHGKTVPDSDGIPTESWERFPNVQANNAIVIHCVSNDYVKYAMYNIMCDDWNRGKRYTSKNPCLSKEFPSYDFSNHKTVEYFTALYQSQKPPLNTPAPSDNDQQVIQISSGTGFAITGSGHIVTNNHVINGCSKILLVNDGKYVPLKVLANDPMNDLAVLKGDFTPSETFAIGKGNPELMQDIYVSGYPFGKKVSTSVKVTRGIISSLTGYGNNFSGIQIDAAIQPGNSGGPIFDDNGNVVGVVVSKLAKQGDITPENTNFGVKANILANILVSNSVPFTEGGKSDIPKSKLSAKASDATFYLSCWNTVAEAKKMRTKKVMFSELD